MGKAAFLRLYQKAMSSLSLFSLVVQTLLPLSYVNFGAFAQDITPEPTSEIVQPTGSELVESTAEPTPEIITEPTLEPTVEPTASEPVVPTLEPTPPVIDIGTLTPPSDPTPIDTPEPTAEAVAEPTLEPATEELAPVADTSQICLSDQDTIIDSPDSDWSIDDQTKVAQTKEPVKLGVRYTFPLEKKVSILFKCLPKDEGLRSSLKIQQVKVSDLKLPDDINPATEFAYDITTDMTDGQFQYDVTLPKPEDSTAEISYIEKSIDEVTNTEVKTEEIKKIDEEKTEQEDETVKGIEVDHFSIYIITYSDGTFSIEKSLYYRGDTLYVKATGLDTTKYYRVSLDEPSQSNDHWLGSSTWQKNRSEFTDNSYTFDSNDNLGSWNAKLWRATNSSGSNPTQITSDTFTLDTTSPDLTVTKTNDTNGNAIQGQDFKWILHVANSGNAQAVFGEDEVILTDNLPSNDGVISYGGVTVDNQVGVSGTRQIECGSISSSDNLICDVSNSKNSGSVIIAAGGSFDVSFIVTINAAGTYINPRNGGSNKCRVDPSSNITESNENNNNCSDTVTVTAACVPLTEICDGIDNNCDGSVDEGFLDTDTDGQADCIDADDDNDGTVDTIDNCLITFNPAQEDIDKDGKGDACDAPECGNGSTETPEECDDGNTNGGDGCSDVCILDYGWYCLGEPSVCNTECGDGRIAGSEVCDDSNSFDYDGCSSVCQPETDWTCDAKEPTICTKNDSDGDGISDTNDNCPKTANSDQADADGDGVGDACQVATACITPPLNMISWWPGDGNINDISGTNNGTAINGSTFASGLVGQAFSFDGVNDYMTVPDSSVWAFNTNDFSIDLWANFNSVRSGPYGQAPNVFVGQDEGSGLHNKWVFSLADDGLNFHINGPASVYIGHIPFSPIIGQWYHLSLTRSGNTYSFYSNGALLGTASDATPIPDVNAPLTIGQVEGLGYFDGLIDEVEIFNRALSQSEITAIYNAGSFGKCKAQVAIEICDNGIDDDRDQDVDCADSDCLNDPICTIPTSTPTPTQTTICGDSNVNQRSEQCDDGNQIDNDYCNNNCQFNDNTCLTDVNMIVNGDFETPVVTDGAKWYFYNQYSPLLGWTTNWYGGFTPYNGQDRPLDANLELHRGVLGTPYSGSQSAELDSDWDGPGGSLNNEPASVKISQILSTIPGYKYEIKYYFSPRPNESAADNVLKSWWNSVDLGNDSAAGSANTSWTERTFTVNATENTTELAFADQGTPNSLGTFIDNVSVKCLGPVATLTPTLTPTATPTPSTCTEGAGWATSVISSTQGNRKNGTPITDPTRMNPAKVLGSNDNVFFSLGYGGQIIVTFSGFVVDQPNANDLSFHEITNGRSTYPIEKALIAVSQNGTDWTDLGEVNNKAGGNGVAYKDLAGSGLAWIKYVRITDTTNDSGLEATADGYDLDAVDLVNQVCQQPTPPVIIQAQKIICDSETYLPNNTQGAITASTAQNWIDQSNGHCRLADNWDFQYGGLGSFGDFQINTQSLPGWQTMTTASGLAQATINDLTPFGNKIEVREVFPDNNYVPFSNGSNITAEIYCTGDTANYDNWEWINNPSSGSTYYCVAFNAPNLGSVSGTKYEDLNSNGLRDTVGDSQDTEPGLQGWTIQLKNLSDVVINSTVTDSKGDYWFDQLVPDTYKICEVSQTGWTQTSTPVCHEVVVNGDDHLYHDFGNSRLSDLHGFKWNDLDGDGNYDSCNQLIFATRLFFDDRQDSCVPEPLLSGWTINLYRWNGKSYDSSPLKSMVTDGSSQHFGWYWFEDLLPGQYQICEVPQGGWTQTYPTPSCHTVNLPDRNSGNLTVSQNAVSGPEYNFGNRQNLPPRCTISKFNNHWPNFRNPGSDIDYTITLHVLDNQLHDAEVIDLPPFGFKYKSGSYHVSVNGVNRSIPEPIYSSPGKWSLGDLNAGDEVILTYTATIDGDLEPGLYKDLAWAYGCTDSTDCQLTSPDRLIAASADSGKLDTGVVSDNYVGTKINLATNLETTKNANIIREEISTGDVLGASTELPSTGANTLWLIVSFIFSSLGLSLILFGKRIFMVFAFIITLSLFFFPPLAVRAVQSDNIFIRLVEPQTPTNQNQFTLDFVTMDQLNRALTVKCYAIKPDASVVQVGSDIAIKAGGNSGQCTLGSFYVDQDGKTYQFYAIASNGGEDYQSTPVSVVYDGKNPDNPSFGGKDKINNCQYKIKFKAANDGQTNIIRIYRSDKTEFAADGGTQVGEVGISPDQEGSYTDIISSDCFKEYYYVIRAFDISGNGSEVVGDSKVVYKSPTTLVTSAPAKPGAIAVSGSHIPPENEPETTDSEIITPSSPDISPEASNNSAGNILGQETKVNQLWSVSKIIALILVIFGILLIGYDLQKRFRQK